MYLLNYFFSIDATFSKRKGRYVNDAARHEELCNAEIRMLYVNYNPVLALFARRFIHAGEEIRYDYGTTDLPWRSKTVFKYVYIYIYIYNIFCMALLSANFPLCFYDVIVLYMSKNVIVVFCKNVSRLMKVLTF